MVGLSVPSKVYAIMAAGRPMLYIGPKGSEAAVLIEEADCGTVIEPGDFAGALDAVLRVYRDRDLLERQGRSGRARDNTRHMSWYFGSPVPTITNVASSAVSSPATAAIRSSPF